MKNLLLTATLLMFAIASSAQTVGVIVQPEFTTSNVRKGFFAESTIYKGIGIYSDFKIMNNDEYFNAYDLTQETYQEQWNVGLSYQLFSRYKAIFSTSVINNERVSHRTKDELFRGEKYKSEPTYQFAAMYSESFLSVLIGYEFQQNNTNSRVSFGLGFNF